MTERYSDRYTDRYTRTPIEGKGPEETTREGTGRHQKAPQAFPWGLFIMASAYVTREAGDVMMTATRQEIAS